MPERTGVQRLSIRARYGDMAPDCCTEYSLGKLYLTPIAPPSSPKRRGQARTARRASVCVVRFFSNGPACVAVYGPLNSIHLVRCGVAKRSAACQIASTLYTLPILPFRFAL